MTIYHSKNTSNIIPTDKYVMELKDLLSTSEWVRLLYKVSICITILLSLLFIYILYRIDHSNTASINNDDDSDYNMDNKGSKGNVDD
jgi:hypothetical protein